MRWHEHFIMNPETNIGTWVICPLPYDRDYVLFNDVDVEIWGGITSGAASDNPVCYFTVVDRRNLAQGEFIQGTSRTYMTLLATSKPTTELWYAEVDNIAKTSIDDAVGSTYPGYWAAAVFCHLPPGHGITQISLY